jgi:hypothetical protein
MASNPLFNYKLPLDLFGDSPANYVPSEIHDVDSSSFIVPRLGSFYVDYLSVFDAATNNRLTPGVDYIILQHVEEATELSGLEVAGLIRMVTAVPQIKMSIQYVGDRFMTLAPLIINLLETLSLDDRPVDYNDIMNLPSLWPAAPHFTYVGDLYGAGLGRMNETLERIVTALTTGSGQYESFVRQIHTEFVNTFTQENEARVAQLEMDISLLQQRVAVLENAE